MGSSGRGGVGGLPDWGARVPGCPAWRPGARRSGPVPALRRAGKAGRRGLRNASRADPERATASSFRVYTLPYPSESRSATSMGRTPATGHVPGMDRGMRIAQLSFRRFESGYASTPHTLAAGLYDGDVPPAICGGRRRRYLFLLPTGPGPWEVSRDFLFDRKRPHSPQKETFTQVGRRALRTTQKKGPTSCC